jgi:hypothetical protein
LAKKVCCISLLQTVRREAMRAVPGGNFAARAGDAREGVGVPRGLLPVRALRPPPVPRRPLRHAGQPRLLQDALRGAAGVRAAQ